MAVGAIGSIGRHVLLASRQDHDSANAPLRSMEVKTAQVNPPNHPIFLCHLHLSSFMCYESNSILEHQSSQRKPLQCWSARIVHYYRGILNRSGSSRGSQCIVSRRITFGIMVGILHLVGHCLEAQLSTDWNWRLYCGLYVLKLITMIEANKYDRKLITWLKPITMIEADNDDWSW